MSVGAVEYAVRAAMPGEEPVTVQVGDEVIMRQTVAEFLQQGATTAEPVMRTVTEWVVDEATRDQVIREVHREAVIAIAQRFWDEEISANHAVVELGQYSDLPEAKRDELLGELVSELEYQEDVENDVVRPDKGEDKLTLQLAAEKAINAAADKLITSAS